MERIIKVKDWLQMAKGEKQFLPPINNTGGRKHTTRLIDNRVFIAGQFVSIEPHDTKYYIADFIQDLIHVSIYDNKTSSINKVVEINKLFPIFIDSDNTSG